MTGTGGGGHSGLALLLREGVVAWMTRRADRVSKIESPREHPAAAAVTFDELHAGVVRVLASMALAGREEMCA